MAASKRVYEGAAEAVRECMVGSPVHYHLVVALGEVFAADNPRFDRQTFYRACGVQRCQCGYHEGCE